MLGMSIRILVCLSMISHGEKKRGVSIWKQDLKRWNRVNP